MALNDEPRRRLGDSEEIRDLDRRSHRNEWRIDSLDKWRDEVARRMTVVEETLDQIIDKHEISEAVGDALKRHHTLILSKWQKFGVGAFAIVAPVASALIVHWLS